MVEYYNIYRANTGSLRRAEKWEISRAKQRCQQAENLIRAARISGDREGEALGEAMLKRWLQESRALIAMHKARMS